MSEEANELVTLTANEDTFCLALFEYGGNIGAAYRAAFGEEVSNPAAKGRNLMARTDIALRIKTLADATQEHAFISLGSHYSQLAEIRDRAIALGDMKTGLTAEVQRGTLAGFYKGKEGPSDKDAPRRLTININAPMTGAAGAADWSAKFGKAPIVIEHEH
jgi:hypothetical protein